MLSPRYRSEGSEPVVTNISQDMRYSCCPSSSRLVNRKEPYRFGMLANVLEVKRRPSAHRSQWERYPQLANEQRWCLGEAWQMYDARRPTCFCINCTCGTAEVHHAVHNLALLTNMARRRFYITNISMNALRDSVTKLSPYM